MGNRYKGYTPAQNAAQQRYMQGKVALRAIVSQEDRDVIQAHAQARGEPVNGFIKRAISEAMERDNAAQRAAEGQTEDARD